MKTNYRALAEKYLRIAEQVAEGLRANEDVLGCALCGSAARGELHPKSDIDLLVLVQGSGIYRWERKVIENVMVNIALRSQDVLERMAEEEPYTIWALQEAEILFDCQGILQALKDEARLTPEAEEEFLGDLLDEARSLIGKAERALDEGDLDSGLLWLRRGVMELAELLFYKEKRRRIGLIHFWPELQELASAEFKELFARIQFQAVERTELGGLLGRLETFLPEPGEL